MFNNYSVTLSVYKLGSFCRAAVPGNLNGEFQFDTMSNQEN